MAALRKLLVLSHRYIGIPLSFMFVLWFASAFIMIYAGGMPRITPEMRIEAGLPLDFSRVALSPAEAAERAGFLSGGAGLRTLLGRPVYVFDEPGWGRSLVFADNGERLGGLDELRAREVAADFLGIPAKDFVFEGLLPEVDQWTLTDSAALPFYKFSAADAAGTQVYVSRDNAEVVVYTTRRSRLLAWLGTIPHWLYFKSLRLDQPLWYDIVVWSAGIGTLLAVLGLCLGVTQFRKVRPFRLSRAIPYQGLMRWHYILGAVFGLFTLTWVFSGLLSMEPFAWTNAPSLDIDRGVYQEGELDPAAFDLPPDSRWNGLVDGSIKEVEFAWIHGAPYYLAHYSGVEGLDSVKRERLHQPYNIIGQAEADSLLIEAGDFRVREGFDPEVLVDKLAAAAPGANVAGYELLASYDDYYYSRNGQLPLPVLRVKFDDPVESWFYVDPRRSEVLTAVNRWGRLERWLYNGLHSLDFAFWYHSRPLWDIGVLLLLAGGLATSCLGLYFGLRRLVRDLHAFSQRLRGGWREGRLKLGRAPH